MKTAPSETNDYKIEFADGSRMTRRETRLLSDGAYFFADELAITGEFSAPVITCAAWLLELYELEAGELFFLQGAEKIRLRSNRFAVFYAPFTISQPGFKNAKGRLRGIASTESVPEGIGKFPVFFETKVVETPASAKQAIEILQTAENRRSVEINPKPSLVSLKAKRLIDENYLIYPSISRVAARLKVSHEHLTRQFKTDFGMTPSAYLRGLRIADAPLRLARGEEIISVSHEVGYNDLSRFYKQFRQTTQTSPGVCRTVLKPKN